MSEEFPSDVPLPCALSQWAADWELFASAALLSGWVVLCGVVMASWLFLREPPEVRILAGLVFRGFSFSRRRSCPEEAWGGRPPARTLCLLEVAVSLPSSCHLAERLCAQLGHPSSVSLKEQAWCLLTFLFWGKMSVPHSVSGSGHSANSYQGKKVRNWEKALLHPKENLCSKFNNLFLIYQFQIVSCSISKDLGRGVLYPGPSIFRF